MLHPENVVNYKEKCSAGQRVVSTVFQRLNINKIL